MMESIHLPGPLPSAQKELIAAVTAVIYSFNKLHLQALAPRLPSLKMKEERRVGLRQWGPEKQARPLLRREGVPRLLKWGRGHWPGQVGKGTMWCPLLASTGTTPTQGRDTSLKSGKTPVLGWMQFLGRSSSAESKHQWCLAPPRNTDVGPALGD